MDAHNIFWEPKIRKPLIIKAHLYVKKCGNHHLSIDDPEENDTGTGRRCTCGNTKFLAHQRSYHDVFVNTDNIFLGDNGIYESERPYGPYTCAECGAEKKRNIVCPLLKFDVKQRFH